MRGTGFVWGLLAKAAPDRTDGQGPGLDRRQVLAGIAAMGLVPSLIDPAEARVAAAAASRSSALASQGWSRSTGWSPPVSMRRSTKRAGASAAAC